MTTDDDAQQDCNNADFWSERYQTGDHKWDLGGETAVFQALRGRHPLFSLSPGQQLSLAIPGCGFGHDALAFAREGFQVSAIDFAHEPLEYLREEAQRQNLAMSILERDIFTLGWDLAASFDRILEYTCYCAIDPARRQEYAHVMATILKAGGYLAGLFFPMDEVEREGPPFTVREEDIRAQFEQEGLVLVSSDIPRESHPARAGRERLMIFRKPV